MSWYKESMNNLIKQHGFDIESSKMPCVRFSKQKANDSLDCFQKKLQDLAAPHLKEEAPNGLA